MDADLSQTAMFLAAGGVQLQHVLFIAGVSMITVALLHRYRKKYKQNVRARITPQEQIERASQHRGLRGDLDQLMVEVEQLTKRFSTQLDAKSIELEQLLRRADERIAQLNQSADPYGVRDSQAGSSGDTARDAIAAIWSNPVESSDQAAPAEDATDALTGRVYAMADTGLGAADIARELDEQIGKVELILALREDQQEQESKKAGEQEVGPSPFS